MPEDLRHHHDDHLVDYVHDDSYLYDPAHHYLFDKRGDDINDPAHILDIAEHFVDDNNPDHDDGPRWQLQLHYDNHVLHYDVNDFTVHDRSGAEYVVVRADVLEQLAWIINNSRIFYDLLDYATPALTGRRPPRDPVT